MTITLSAEAGVLPEGTTAEIEAVLLSEVEGIPEEILEQYVDDYIYDITLYDAEGEELSDDWSENGTVKVTFSGEKIEEMTEAEGEVDVLHIEEDEEEAKVEIVEEDAAKDAEIAVEAEHFSYYAPLQRNDIVLMTELPDGISEADVRYPEIYMEAGDRITLEGAGYWVIERNHSWQAITELNGISINKNDSDAIVRVAEYTDNGTVYIKHSWDGVADKGEEYFIIHIVDDAENTSPAYFYVKRAQFAASSGSAGGAGTNSDNYEFWGIGSVPLPSAKSMVSVYPRDQKFDLQEQTWESEVNYPDASGTPNAEYNGSRVIDSEGYPILYLDNTAYFHEDSGDREADDYRYTVEWSTFSIADGAVGSDHEALEEATAGLFTDPTYTYHIDGDVYLRNTNEIQITAYWQTQLDQEFTDDPKEGRSRTEMAWRNNIVSDWNAMCSTIEEEINISDDLSIEWYFDDAGNEPYNENELESLAEEGEPIHLYGILKEKVEDVEITFVSEYGFEGDADKKEVVTLQKPEDPLIAPTPVDTETDGVIWTGWKSGDTTYTKEAFANLKVPDAATTYEAVYEDDKDNNNEPDKDQKYDLTYETGLDAGVQVTGMPENTQVAYGESVTISETPDADYYVFKGWTSEDVIISNNQFEMPNDAVTVTAEWYADTDNDGTPDEQEKEITFVSEHGFDGDADKTEVVTLQKPEDPLTAPTPVDTETDGVVWTGWKSGNTTYTKEEFAELKVPDTATTYEAVYEDDKDNNNEPDKDQKYDLMYETGLDAGIQVTGMPENTQVAYGETVTIRETPDAEYYVFKGWTSVDVTISNNQFEMPNDAVTVTAEWYADTDNDGTPDEQEKEITFVSEHGFDGDADKTEVVTLQKPEDPLTAPTPVDTETDGVIWTGWTDGTKDYTKDEFEALKVPSEDVTYTALYVDDKNNNEQPDDTEPATASITPYNTHIYVGGTNDYGEAGLPNLELELTAGEVNRPVEGENVTSIFINGVAQPVGNGKTIDTYLRAVYVDDNGNVITDDAQHDAVSTTGTYNIEVALTSVVVTANEEAGIETATAGDETDSGYLMGADGRPVLARQSTVLINNNKINFGSSKEDAAQLVVRSVSDTEAARKGEIYRTIYTEEGTVAEGRAIAVIDPSTTYYTNDIEDGRVIDDSSGIRLMVDDVLAPTENDGAEREKLLKEKANAALPELNGMTAEEAEAAGYHYVLRYMDLVDSNNGNAWVSSSAGTDVYVPYQTSDGSETEYRIIHFKDLHREYGLTGQDVVDAINQGAVEIMDIENTPYGIKFHTDAAGFSPFAIIWNENGNFDGTSDDEQGGTTGIGSAGGHNESDRNSIGGTYYTVGVNGNWRHMDNVDVNAPLDEAVPAGATAMAAPEWHRWKFFRNDGSNIRSQWAHIANPYAVDDQPKTGWFYFDAEGLMQYGWFLDTATGKWYYLHAESDGMLGTMMTGWHYDLNDGRWYYLDPVTGEMLLGWQNIGGKWYYFNTAPNEQTWNLDSVAGLWRFNNSTARPLGSMYINETTPDGYQVDGSGAWIQ